MFPFSTSEKSALPSSHPPGDGNTYHLVGDDDDGVTKRTWKDSPVARAAFALLPAFVSSYFGYDFLYCGNPKVYDTTYLNGVRGLAAMAVCFQHMITPFYPDLFISGPLSRPQDVYLLQLPLLRLIFDGGLAVHVFFILSGFVLAYGPLRTAHAGDAESAITGIPARIFRRPFRLFMPLFPQILLICFLIEMGHWPETPMGSLWAHFQEGFRLFWFSAWGPFRYIKPGQEDISTIPSWAYAWTLSCEFRGSLVVYVTCLQCRMKPWLRLVGVLAFAWATLQQGYYDISLFLAGMMLAELRLLRLPGRFMENLSPVAGQAVAVAWVVVLVISLYVGGYPQLGGPESPWFAWLSSVPTIGSYPYTFFLCISAFGVVLSLENLPLLQGLLNSPVPRYLGEISFGLYLVHWAVVFSMAKPWIEYWWALGWDHALSCAFGVGLFTFVCIWLGDVYTRLVDRRCVQFANWLAKKVGV